MRMVENESGAHKSDVVCRQRTGAKLATVGAVLPFSKMK